MHLMTYVVKFYKDGRFPDGGEYRGPYFSDEHSARAYGYENAGYGEQFYVHAYSVLAEEEF